MRRTYLSPGGVAMVVVSLSEARQVTRKPGPLGRRLKALRKEHGWVIEELSRRAGVSISAISEIERGDTQSPGAVVLRKLAEALGTTVSFLTEGEALWPDSTQFVMRGGVSPSVLTPDDLAAIEALIRRILDERGRGGPDRG